MVKSNLGKKVSSDPTPPPKQCYITQCWAPRSSCRYTMLLASSFAEPDIYVQRSPASSSHYLAVLQPLDPTRSNRAGNRDSSNLELFNCGHCQQKLHTTTIQKLNSVAETADVYPHTNSCLFPWCPSAHGCSWLFQAFGRAFDCFCFFVAVPWSMTLDLHATDWSAANFLIERRSHEGHIISMTVAGCQPVTHSRFRFGYVNIENQKIFQHTDIPSHPNPGGATSKWFLQGCLA